MLYSSLFAATALVGAAFAEDHKVIVSDKQGSLLFKPDSLTAAEGDTVTFHFWPKNHSVAQSTFDSPCEPMQGGFWSGYVPTASTESLANTTFTYEVMNASAPIWFYCTQGMHCQNGMVGVINPPESDEKTLDAFKNAAADADMNVTPTSTAGTGGNRTESSTTEDSPSPSSPTGTGAASHVAGSAVFAGL
ncbi:Cupredoxin, partial [Decorospora gaudefroyi]